MRFSFLKLIVLSLQLATLQSPVAHAVSPPFDQVPPSSVFASSHLLSIEIEAPLAELFAHRTSQNFLEIKKQKVFGTLRYFDENGRRIAVAIQLRIKGFSSIRLCRFPKLELKIDKTSSRGTIFDRTGSIDLNTHCDYEDPEMRARSKYDSHREELLYQLARVLEIP